QDSYQLEVYVPASTDTVFAHFESSLPFLPIHPGDIVNPGIWEDSQSPMRVLRVLNVEHIIWKSRNGEIKHKLMVYTDEVAGTRELRLQPNDLTRLTRVERWMLSNQLRTL